MIIDELERYRFKSITHEPAIFQAIRKMVIQAKHELSVSDHALLEIYSPAEPGGGYNREITRDEFDSLITDLVERTLGPCKQALKDANLNPDQIDEVVMVGGSTRIPLVRSKVKELFR